MLKKSIKIITNKYFIAGMIFVVWSAFFDQNDWFTMQGKKNDLEDLTMKVKYMNNEISRMEEEKKTLTDTTDLKQLEVYARENYRMRKNNEDVYVIESSK